MATKSLSTVVYKAAYWNGATDNEGCDEVIGDAFEIEVKFTDSHILTEQALMHATERV